MTTASNEVVKEVMMFGYTFQLTARRENENGKTVVVDIICKDCGDDFFPQIGHEHVKE